MSLWISVVDADTYFGTRLNATSWTGADTSTKTAALTTGQNDLISCGLFGLSDETEPTTSDQNAVCEQAIFLLQEEDAVDRRAALRAQAVKSAGVIKEAYEDLNGIAIAKRASAFLRDRDVRIGASGIDEIERDE